MSSVELPHGTPAVLPVDATYALTARTRRDLRVRMKLHGFDLSCPKIVESARIEAVEQVGRTRRYSLRCKRPVKLGPKTALLLESPEEVYGFVGGGVRATRAATVMVEGEPLPGLAVAARRLRNPLYGGAMVAAGRESSEIREVELIAYEPDDVEVIDRYPVHRPLRVGRTFRLPCNYHRRGQRIEQISIHWGSVEYVVPDRTRPLAAWGYPYYLDGVLGDVDFERHGRRTRVAEGKFLEFDEVENIRLMPPQAADCVLVTLRPRDGRVPVPECRIAAIEIRYETKIVADQTIAFESWRVPAGHSRALMDFGSARGVRRVDVVWSDRGPAMGSVSIGGRDSGWANVCSGENKIFTYTFGGRSRTIRLRARAADIIVGEVSTFFAR